MSCLWRMFVCVSNLATLVITFEAEEFVVRETLNGQIRGIVKTVLGSKKIEQYFSVPYAAPPVGELRFEIAEGVGQMAVLVHIHGGSNHAGMGAMLDMDLLSAQGRIIVINFNYRLSALGFLNGGRPEFPGNYGLLDQTAALQWVSRNIHFFGGDPNKVTVEGHSAGAADVGYHIVSPLSKGLFRFAIIQSGSPTAHWASSFQQQGGKVLSKFGESLGCDTSKDMWKLKQCLKTKSWRDINDRDYSRDCVPWSLCLSPVIDGFFVQKHVDILFKEAELNGEAFMVGITRDEGREWGLMTTPMMSPKNVELFASYDIDMETSGIIAHEYYPWNDPLNRTAHAIAFGDIWGDNDIVAPTFDVATRLSARTDNVYFYSFDYASPTATVPGVPHGRDLFYLFGCPFSGHPRYNYTEEDRQVSKVFMNMWINFVKAGKPSSTVKTDPVYFQQFDSEIQAYMKIDVVDGNGTIETAYKPRPRQMAFWNSVLPQIAALQSQSIQSEKYGKVTWSLASISGILFLCVIVSVVFLVRKQHHDASQAN
ncbi:acetylcholinesterase-like isoform X2 [Haliotis cracherodii]|uniref:acetylcholinesterase-like isoform X2 n=1 Tax=Haliotis cracherodii TaxID=6455 RepID=UPI0039EAF8D3